ncbi:type VI secretion system tube protein TssD, partial [Proteus mirabilis]
MSFVIYLRLEGSKQGLISKDCSTADSIGNRYQLGREDEIQVIGTNGDISREQNATNHPIQILKPIDKSSPLLGIAIGNNEILKATLSFYRTSLQGSLEKYYEIKLTDVSISNLSFVFPNSINNNDLIPYEKLT